MRPALRPAALLLALALAGSARAQLAPVTFGPKAGDASADAGLAIGGSLDVPAYRLVRLSAKGVPAKAGVLWEVDPPAAVDWVTPSGKVPSWKTRTPEFVAPPGTYSVRLSVITVDAEGLPDLNVARAVLTIGVGPPVPPGPTPPGPTPDPSDPLLATLQTAFKADGSPVASARKLAAVFRLGASTVAGDNSLATRKALNDLMHRTADNAVGSDTLKATREAVAVELDKAIGGKEADPLPDAERAKYRTQYARIAGLLEALK